MQYDVPCRNDLFCSFDCAFQCGMNRFTGLVGVVVVVVVGRGMSNCI